MFKWLIIFLNLFIASNYLTEACLSCSKHTYKPYFPHTKNFAKLSDSKKLKHIVQIGTHLSFSYKSPFEEIKTQELDIEQQLKYGVRVFDICVLPKLNSFELFANHSSLKIYLHDVLTTLDKFLDDNPSELIIMHINEDEDDSAKIINNKTNCELIDYHKKNIYGGWSLTTKWNLEDTIGIHRGEILLASSDKSFSGCAFSINNHCHVQNDKFIKLHQKSPDFFDKWDYIDNSIEYSKHQHFQCYLNDISFDDGVNSRKVIAKDGGYEFKTRCPRPMNELMVESFTNLHRALIIVLADFVTQELIDSINESNY